MSAGAASPHAAAALREAAAHVAAGGLVAYPTETLYGLGASARDERALARLRAWKGRDAAQAISVLIDAPESLAALDVEIGSAAARLVARFWPGPLTLVLRTRERFAAGIVSAQGGIGVRCSPHPVARALARAVAEAGAGPLTATSLNRHGEPPAATLARARALCAAADAPRLLEIAGAPEPAGIASTVVDALQDPPRVLREGAISTAAIHASIRGGAPSSEERPA